MSNGRKWIFLALVLMTALATSLAARSEERPRIIALQMEGLLAQATTAEESERLWGYERFTIDLPNGTAKTYLYKPGARDLIAILPKWGYEVHIYSNQTRAELDLIGRSFAVGYDSLSPQVTLHGRDEMRNGSFDLRIFKRPLREVLLIGSSGTRVVDGQESSFWDLGPSIAYFASLDDVPKIDPKNPRARFLPKTEEDIEREKNKLNRVAAILKVLSDEQPKNFFERLVTLRREDARAAWGFGAEVIRGYTPYEGNWNWRIIETENGKGQKVAVAKGCSREGVFPAKVNTNIEHCLEQLGSSQELRKSNGKFACALVTSERAFIKWAPRLDDCLNSDVVQYFYRDPQAKTCGAFTEKLEFVKSVETSWCSREYVVFDDEGKAYKTTEFDGIERLTKSQLAKKLRDDYIAENQMWQPFRPAILKDEGGLDLKQCLSDDWQSMKTDRKGELASDCTPNVLYSWGPQERLDNILQEIGGQKTWPQRMSRALYSARAPVATFGYGPIPIRIKLKKGTKFRSSSWVDRNCSSVEPGVVYFRNDGRFSDWTICDASVIHSWSVYTKGHYDEMARDFLLWRNTGGRPDRRGVYDYYASSHARANTLFGITTDGWTDFSEETLKSRMIELGKRTRAGQGKIYYNPTLPASEKTESNHFENDHRIKYIRPAA